MLGGQDRRASAQAGGQSPHVARGHIPRNPLANPLTQMARCATARMRARPAARRAQNGTRRPPQRGRAAETVNVNVSYFWSARFLSCKRERRVQWSYGAAVTSCSGGFAAVAKAPASMRWVVGWSTTGPDSRSPFLPHLRRPARGVVRQSGRPGESHPRAPTESRRDTLASPGSSHQPLVRAADPLPVSE